MANGDGGVFKVFDGTAYKMVRMLGSLDDADNVRNGLTYVGCGSGALAVAIPFYTMANRAKSVQEVWTTQRGWKPSDTWWEGGLYRNANETMAKAVAPVPPRKMKNNSSE